MTSWPGAKSLPRIPRSSYKIMEDDGLSIIDYLSLSMMAGRLRDVYPNELQLTRVWASGIFWNHSSVLT